MISGEYQCHLFHVNIAKECIQSVGLGSHAISADSVFALHACIDIAADMEVGINVVNVLLGK